MTQSSSSSMTIVCLSTHFSGADFIRECSRQGHRVILLTKEKNREAAWPFDCLDDLVGVANDAETPIFLDVVGHIARRLRVSRVVALHEFDVLTAALVREHLNMPGMGVSQVRNFRDKLAMRVNARQAGVPVPDFVHVLHYDDVHFYLNTVPPPWMLKPRSNAGGIGIRKLHTVREAWEGIGELERRHLLHERPSHYLIERFVPGTIYHVDSLVCGDEIVFSSVGRYGRAPFDVYHQGGVFTSRTVERDTPEERDLLECNRRIIKGLELTDSAAHAEFIRGDEDGKLYFLEIAARVGGAHIADTVEAATGINLWREWVKIETAGDPARYQTPTARRDYSGVILSLARDEWPDTSGFDDPEIVERVQKKYHIGFVLRSESHARVQDLLSSYERRIREGFLAVAPPVERPEEL